MSKWWSGIWSGFSKRFLQVLLVVLVLLWALPELLRISLIVASPRMGVGALEIRDIDLNLFSGRLAVTDLQLSRDDQKALLLQEVVLDKGWLGWLDREWQVEELSLSGAVFSVQQLDSGGWQVVMPLPVGKEQAQEETVVEIPRASIKRLSISNSAITLDSQWTKGRLAIKDLSVNHASTWREEPTQLTMVLRWNDAAIRLQAEGQSLLENPEIKGELRIEGLQAADFAQAAQPHVASLQGTLSSDLAFVVRQFDKESFGLELEGTLALDDVSARYRHMQLDNQQLTWRGVVDAATQPQGLTFLVTSLIENQQLKIADAKRELTLLEWQSLKVDSLTVDNKNTIKLEALNVNKPRLVSRGEESLLAMSALTLDQLNLEEGNELAAGVIAIHDSQYHLVINPEGNIALRDAMQTSLSDLSEPAAEPSKSESAKPEPTAKTTETEPFRFAIEKVRWLGDNVIYFTDQRFGTPVEERLTINALEAGPIDQINPDKPLQLVIKGEVGEFSTLDISGQVQPFLAAPKAAIKGDLKNINLPFISPYVESVLGYELQTGQYDHKLDVEVKDNTIKLNNDLSLRQLTVAAVEDGKEVPLDQQLDVPLGMALDMLRDSDDNIHLEVPIEGRLDDPSVDVSDVIGKAMAKALKAGSVGYLKYAIQPFGAALMVGEMLVDQASTIQFDPMTFDVGSNTLPTGQSEYVTKLAGLLSERPNLQLKLCGESNQADRQSFQTNNSGADDKAVNTAMVTLATERGDAVKRALLDAGADGSRLFQCKSRFEQEGVHGVRLMM